MSVFVFGLFTLIELFSVHFDIFWEQAGVAAKKKGSFFPFQQWIFRKHCNDHKNREPVEIFPTDLQCFPAKDHKEAMANRFDEVVSEP